MTLKLFLAGLMVVVVAANAQNTQESCRCVESFEWLRPTFESNDSGFGYIVKRKGQVAYDLHNQMTLERPYDR